MPLGCIGAGRLGMLVFNHVPLTLRHIHPSMGSGAPPSFGVRQLAAAFPSGSLSNSGWLGPAASLPPGKSAASPGPAHDRRQEL